MERKVLSFIREHNMFQAGDSIVVGVSGGADSMCLLRILISLRDILQPKDLVTVHVNHGIRGESADADELFVERYCRDNGVKFVPVHENVPAIAKNCGLTEEEAGRKVRYEAFMRVCREYGCNRIAVAHNGDDNAETVLFNIARGSGISGLRGISPLRDMGDGITLVRPLLECTRAQIEAYLADRGMSFRTDETNLQDEYSRNKIRHIVLPALCEAANPAASRNIRELAARAAELEDYVREMTEREIRALKSDARLKVTTDTVTVSVDALEAMHPTLRKAFLRTQIGFLAGKLKDIEAVHVDAVCGLISGRVGRSVDLPYGIAVRRGYGEIIMERGTAAAEKEGSGEDFHEIRLTIPGEYALGDGRVLKADLITYEKTLNIPQNDYTKFFDYDKIMDDLTLRTRRTGDYLLIKGPGNGEKDLLVKSLKTWFIDNRIPAADRAGWPLLAEGPHILWVIGERGDDSCLVSSLTRTILRVELVNK